MVRAIDDRRRAHCIRRLFDLWAEPRVAFSLVTAVSVLIIACPCALGLATSMASRVGVGSGAQAGAPGKNAEELERLEKVETLVIDETGTVTEGKPKVVAILPAKGNSEADLLRLSASVERASEHAVGAAILTAASERNITIAKVEDLDASIGKGVRGTIEGRKIALGNAQLLAELGVEVTTFENDADRLRRDGATVIFLAIDPGHPFCSSRSGVLGANNRRVTAIWYE